MKQTNGGGSSLQELARLGAPMRIKAIEAELQGLYTLFPELFPAGVPVITRPERKPVEASTAAQRLIEGAEAIHARVHGKKPRPVRKARRPRGPNIPNLPKFEKINALTSTDRLSATEAAEIFGCSTSNIYLQVKARLLKPVDHKGDHGGARFRADDLKAVLLKRADEIWAEHQGKTAIIDNANQPNVTEQPAAGSEQVTEHVQEQGV